MHCLICSGSDIKKIYSNFPGYIAGSNYDIYECYSCLSQFILSEKIDISIYDKIYSTTNLIGYDRYYKYAEQVKKEKNPLKYLGEQELIYYPIYDYLKDKGDLEILEIGCGYGYLSYSMRLLGNNVLGIDISKTAIKYANDKYGNFYKVSDISNLLSDKKFDLIVATELIEHLSNPNEFVVNCCKFLKDDGKIIITTPNKDYYDKLSIWKTDLPPVHTYWLGKTSFKHLANANNLYYKFPDLSNFIEKNDNKLLVYIRMKLNFKKNPIPVLDTNGQPYIDRVNSSKSFFLKYIRPFFLFKFIRIVGSFLFNFISDNTPTLAVVLWKK